MAKLYTDKDVTVAVAPEKLPNNYDELSKEDKEKVKKSVKESKDFILRGQKRIMEKVKEIRHIGAYFIMKLEKQIFRQSKILFPAFIWSYTCKYVIPP